MVVARRVLMVGLDGYDPALGGRLMAEGELPALKALMARSARFDLEHGAARRTGLAWEHVSSGRSPEAAQRSAPVHFDRNAYTVRQEPTSLLPFPAALSARTVVFDAPYFDLLRAPRVRGLVGWGAHDPGVPAAARPETLPAELATRFGPYPAKRWIYGYVWPSPEQTREMGEALVKAVDVRAAASCWLLREALPDWDLGYLVVSELHSASEALWHGVDPGHPLHGHASAGPAGAAMKDVYRAVDRLVGSLAEAFPDVTLVVFNLHGMGHNGSDLPSMALLPELLFKHATGKGLFRAPVVPGDAGALVDVPAGSGWGDLMDARMTVPRPRRPRKQSGLRRAIQVLRGRGSAQPAGPGIGWIPAARYSAYWPVMPAFALPAFYGGRVRINLAGRERRGLVRPADYSRVCDEVEQLVRDCRDTRTGEPVVESVERMAGRDPLTIGETEADIVIVWRGSPAGFVHPSLGQIGPLPYRRTGGHTGGPGMAYVSGPGIASADHGMRDAFDVVPTIVELLGEARPAWMSGESFASLLIVRAGG
jgi:predicted AlkP superfamily phosphohydrolase/phosphomutase